MNLEEGNLRFQRQDQATFLSDSQRADHLGHRPALHSLRRPVVALHGRLADIAHIITFERDTPEEAERANPTTVPAAGERPNLRSSAP